MNLKTTTQDSLKMEEVSKEPIAKEWRILGLNMWQQVLVGLLLGIIVGAIFGKDVEFLKIFGTIFIRLIKMVVSPLIFFALISGITSLTASHHFKGIALKGSAAYVLTAVVAVGFGLILANIFQPGVGVPKPAIDTSEMDFTSTTIITMQDFLFNLIPANIVNAIAEDNYIQIVIFAIFTGVVMNNIHWKTTRVKEINQEMAHVTFKMIEWLVRFAPLAVFGLIASLMGTTGHDVILSLIRLVGLVIAACFFQYLLFGVLIMIFARISPLPFYRKMLPTQIMAFSTSSTKATLTTAMRELQEKMGVSSSTSNFMMPLGACVNMAGTAIYLGIASVFFAQMFGIHLTATDYWVLMFNCTLGSIGAAGIPSGSVIFMGMVLSSVGIPVEGIAVILGIDRILDMFRTVVNITGDAAITIIVDKSEQQLDLKTYNS